jgi:hypothetical protein
MTDRKKPGPRSGRQLPGCDVIQLDMARLARSLDGAVSRNTGTSHSGLPDLAGIAREPCFAERRRKLAEAMMFFSGTEPDDVLLDHQMIVTGLAAGHGGDEGGRPLGQSMDDPAVVVGLVLHYARHNARRGLPIPSSVLRQLDHHVAKGSAAARLVRDWLRSRSVPCDRRRLWVHDGGKA